MPTADPQVAVIGGGVVGCAVAHALARRGVEAVAAGGRARAGAGCERAPTRASCTPALTPRPGELETTLILRSAALREELLDELGVAAWRCGALLQPRDGDEREAVVGAAENARANGVEAHLRGRRLAGVPGEAVTDPVAFVNALAGAACAGGADVRLGARVSGLSGAPAGVCAVELTAGEQLQRRAAVNCAGLYADEVAALAGDEPVDGLPSQGRVPRVRAGRRRAARADPAAGALARSARACWCSRRVDRRS